MTATLALYTTTDADLVPIAGRAVPIEVEPSAALAYTLSNPAIWAVELRGFFAGALLADLPTHLGALEPHHPGRIPVVFVHGTASSAGRWADMVNIRSSATASSSGSSPTRPATRSPTRRSCCGMRSAGRSTISTPGGDDAALRNMVVIGHSQGGLLTKMTAIDTGSRLYDNIASKPLDQLRLRPETRALIERALFIEPLPFVRRVLFVSTPHRGSYLAEWSIRRLIARFVRLPLNLARGTLGQHRGRQDVREPPENERADGRGARDRQPPGRHHRLARARPARDSPDPRVPVSDRARGLLFGGRAAANPEFGKVYAGALTIFLILLGLGVSPLPADTPDSFSTRIVYVLFAIIYTICLAVLLWPRAEPTRPAWSAETGMVRPLRTGAETASAAS